MTAGGGSDRLGMGCMFASSVCRESRVQPGTHDLAIRMPFLAVIASVLVLAGCASSTRPRESIDPDTARAAIEARIPPKVSARDGWAVDIFAAFEALGIAPTTDNVCA